VVSAVLPRQGGGRWFEPSIVHRRRERGLGFELSPRPGVVPRKDRDRILSHVRKHPWSLNGGVPVNQLPILIQMRERAKGTENLRLGPG
jgi:hypothetical protein